MLSKKIKGILLLTLVVLIFTTGTAKANPVYAWESTEEQQKYYAQYYAYEYATHIVTGDKDPNCIRNILSKGSFTKNEYREKWIQFIFAVGLERGVKNFVDNIDYMESLGYWSDDYEIPEYVEPQKDGGSNSAWTFFPTNGIGDCTAYSTTAYENWTELTAWTDDWMIESGYTPSTCKISSVDNRNEPNWLLYHDEEKGEFVRTSIKVDQRLGKTILRNKATYEAFKDLTWEEIDAVETYIWQNESGNWAYGEAPSQNILDYIAAIPNAHVEALEKEYDMKASKKVTPTPTPKQKATPTPMPEVTNAPTVTPEPVISPILANPTTTTTPTIPIPTEGTGVKPENDNPLVSDSGTKENETKSDSQELTKNEPTPTTKQEENISSDTTLAEENQNASTNRSLESDNAEKSNSVGEKESEDEKKVNALPLELENTEADTKDEFPFWIIIVAGAALMVSIIGVVVYNKRH